MKNIKLDSFFKELEAGLEANISMQNDPVFINNCLEQLYKMCNTYKDKKNLYKNSEDLFKYSSIANETKNKLNDIINKRFGINFKILPDITSNACVFIITSENYNVLNKYSENIREEILNTISTLKQFNNMEERPEVINDDSSMKMSTTSGMIKIYEQMMKSTDALEEMMKVSQVEFDLKNAKIKGLPETMISVMAVDFVSFFNILTVEELLAVILHEVGHQYTHLANMYRVARTNTLLQDTMKLTFDEKPEVIRIALEKQFNIKMPKFENLSTDANIKDLNNFISEIITKATYQNTNVSKVSSRDSEALADQFAGRFGLEKEIFSALNKISTSFNEADMMLQEPLLYAFLVARIILSLLAIILFTLMIITGGVSALFLYLLKTIFEATLVINSASIIVAIGHFTARFLLGDMDSFEMVYDDKKRRLERIRNDAIRNLRGIVAEKGDKIFINAKLDVINEMEEVIAKTRKGRSIIAIFGEMVFPWNRKHSTETMYQQMLENLEANKLDLLSEKFKY